MYENLIIKKSTTWNFITLEVISCKTQSLIDFKIPFCYGLRKFVAATGSTHPGIAPSDVRSSQDIKIEIV